MATIDQHQSYLSNVFRGKLGAAQLTNGIKAQVMQMFNREIRYHADRFYQEEARGRHIEMADYDSYADGLLNQYANTCVQQASYAPQIRYQPQMPMQPMYGQPMGFQQPMYGQPMYPQQPMYGQPMMQQQVYYGSTGPMQMQPQPMYQNQPIMAPEQNLYSGALGGQRQQPVFAQQRQQGQIVYRSNQQPQQPTFAQPMTPQPVTMPPQPPTPDVQTPPVVIQASEPSYHPPKPCERKIVTVKTPVEASGERVKYQQGNGKTVSTLHLTVKSPVKDINYLATELRKKHAVEDVTLVYNPHELIAGDLADMQKSSMAIKKLITVDKPTGEIVTDIVNYLDAKTKGVSKFVENIILGNYNKFATVLGKANVPTADSLEDLQVVNSSQMEDYILKAFSAFRNTSVYDPGSSQLAAFLKDVDTLTDKTYAELKKNKSEFTAWAKSHCVIKHATTMYRLTSFGSVSDSTKQFGYTDELPPDDDLEFFTMEVIHKYNPTFVTMDVMEKNFAMTFEGFTEINGHTQVEFIPLD